MTKKLVYNTLLFVEFCNENYIIVAYILINITKFLKMGFENNPSQGYYIVLIYFVSFIMVGTLNTNLKL